MTGISRSFRFFVFVLLPLVFIAACGGGDDGPSTTPEPVDTTPEAFTFAAVSDAALATSVTSAPVTVAGINGPAAIRIEGGEYAIAGGAFVSTEGSITNGQSVVVRLMAANALSTERQATLTIGGVSAIFSVTTEALDTTPDTFTFTAVTQAELSSTVASNEIVVAGINAEAAITVDGGSYRVDDGNAVSTPGTVLSGQRVRVQLATAATLSTASEMTLTIGGVSATFTATTRGDITAPVASLRYPLSGVKTDGDSIYIRGTASDAESAITAVSVNGIAATSEDDFATWEATVSLSEGVNALAVSTTDSAGNTDASAALLTVLRGGGASAYPDNNHPLGLPTALYLDAPRQRILVGGGTSGAASAIFAIDMASGARSVFSDASTPNATQTAIANPTHFLASPAGDVMYVLDTGTDAIYTVDLATGNRTALVDASSPGLSAANFDNPSNMIFNPDDANEILFLDQVTNETLRGVDIVDQEGREFVPFTLFDSIEFVDLFYSSFAGELLTLNSGNFSTRTVYTLDKERSWFSRYDSNDFEWDFDDWYKIALLPEDPLGYVINGAPDSTPSEGIRIETFSVLDVEPGFLSSNTLPNSFNAYASLHSIYTPAEQEYILVISSNAGVASMLAIDKQTGQRLVLSSWSLPAL